MKKIINLTPHSIDLEIGGKSLSFPPSGIIARCEEETKNVGYILYDGIEIPVIKKNYGKSNLPAYENETIYVVSLPIVMAHPDRTDLLIPGEVIRDEKGRIIGCKSFAKI